METDLAEMLCARERRFAFQRRLLNEYQSSLITFVLNIPGVVKQSEKFKALHNRGMKLLQGLFSVSKLLFCASFHKNAGSEGYLCLDVDAVTVKRKSLTLEETHTLGRLFDIDVFDSFGNPISRTKLGYPTRKCLICNDDAKVCIRVSRHGPEELQAAVNEIIHKNKDLISKIISRSQISAD
jgi:holo-ACP synthase